MRIAHFIHRYPPALGGAEAYFARLSRHFVRLGHHVTVFTTNADDLSAFWSPSGKCLPAGESWEGGVQVRRYPLWRMHGRRWLLKPLSMIPHMGLQTLTMPCNPISFAMWRDVDRLKEPFDAVHATAFPYLFPIAAGFRFARRLGIPFYLTPFLHLGDPDDPHDRVRQQYTAAPMRRLLNEADGIFVQSKTELEAVDQLGVQRSRVILQGLGVDPHECTGGNRDKSRINWGTNAKTFVIGHLANLSDEKGTVDLLKAVQQLPTDFDLLVVLAGPRMANFDRFWEQHAPRHRVLILGRLTDDERRDFLAGIDVFALPSRCDSFGLVIPESWANAKPVVAYRAGGVADLVRDCEDGLLVKCGNVQTLAAVIGRLAADAPLCQRLGQAGRRRALHELRWEAKLNVVVNTIAPAAGRAISA